MKTANFSLMTAAVLLFYSLITPARATTRTVTSLNDSGTGTLRDAISASASGDTINFAVFGTITLTSGELLLARDLTIAGPGATNLTISGNRSSRVFENTANSTTIYGLTISNGLALGGVGSRNVGGWLKGKNGVGGGVANYQNLVLSNCYIVGNTAKGSDLASNDSAQPCLGGYGVGGGLYNSGSVLAVGCTFGFNSAIGGSAGTNGGTYGIRGIGGSGIGGAINDCYSDDPNNKSFGQIVLKNCTFFQNGAYGGAAGTGYRDGGDGGLAHGGSIWSEGNSVYVQNCSLSANFCRGGNTTMAGFGGEAFGGGFFIETNSLTNYAISLKNTIIAGNSVVAGFGLGLLNQGSVGGPDIVDIPANFSFLAAVASAGCNLIGIADHYADIFWSSTDLVGKQRAPLDPRLGGLQNNGGPTPTLALFADSPAIDAGDDAVLSSPYFITTDQRGVHRPNGFHVDIGAYEFGGTELVTSFADSGLGSLRNAIASAADGDRVIFTPLITGTIFLNSGELPITNQVSIIGPGATNLTISGSNSNRVFHVNSTGSLNLIGLTVADGLVAGSQGTSGNSGTVGGDAIGGGLFNQGISSLTACIVTNCSVVGGRGGASTADLGPLGGTAAGAGIYNSGVLTMLQSTLSGNSALGGTGGTGGKVSNTGLTGGTGGTAFGAGFANSGVATLTSCTLAANTATGGTGGTGGGGIQTTGGNGGQGGIAYGAAVSPFAGSFSMTSCTISSNQSIAGFGGPGGRNSSSGLRGSGGGPGSANSGGLNSSGSTQLQNCLIAGNQADSYPDVAGTVNSGGFNLVGIADGSSGWLVPEVGTLGNSSFPINPKLGPLQNNGGPTPTMALLNGSPALDKGNSSGTSQDQRGYPRVFDISSVTNATGGDGSDIGAFEASVAPTLTPSGHGSNPFNILLTGSPGWTYAIQASTNGGGPGWTSLITNASPFTFADTNAVNFTRRFYRAVSLP